MSKKTKRGLQWTGKGSLPGKVAAGAGKAALAALAGKIAIDIYDVLKQKWRSRVQP